MNHADIRHPLLDYLDNIPAIQFNQLYQEPCACLFIFRLAFVILILLHHQVLHAALHFFY